MQKSNKLKERTGLPFTRIEIGELDFVRDTAQIRVYYKEHMKRNGQIPFTSTINVADESE